MTIQYTTNFNLPYPQLTDTPNVPRDIQALATAVDGLSIALKTGSLAQFASTTSAQLRTLISDETGSGALVFGTAPTISSPVIQGTVTVPAPTNPGDIATKSYVDAISAGINVHDAVKLATAAALTGATYAQITSSGVDTTGGYGPGATLTLTPTSQSIDGTVISTLSVGDRILVKDQATTTQNGVYSVTTLSPFVLTRASDSDNSIYGEVAPGDMVYVTSGSANIGNAYVMNKVGTGTNGTIKIGTDVITWTQYTGSLPLPLSAANGGTGTLGTLNGILYGNLTSAATVATGTQISAAIGTTTITNATNSTNTTNVAIATDTATATTYPLFTNSTTSPISPKYNTSLTYNATNGTLSATTISGTNLGGSLLSATTPLVNGTAAVGTATVPSRQDHVHPTDTTRASTSSPTITTPTIDTVNTSLTTAGTAALWNTGITTGTISIGGSLTTGTISIATGGSSATNINIGHTGALIGLTGNTTVTGTLTATSTVDASAGVTSFFATPTSITLGAAATSATLFGAATTLSLGNTATAAQTVNMFTASTGASTYNIATGATTSATTKAVNIGGGGVSGSVTNITLGSTTSGAIGTTRITGSLALATPPAIITATTYTVGINDTYLIFNTTAACTVTMPSASTYSGRVITLKQIAAFAVNSSSSTGNLGVVPLTTTTAGTAILSGAGKFAHLVSDGTNWVTMMSN